jgi:hypothetical protein
MAKKYYYNILCWFKGLDPINFSFSTFPMLCEGKVVGGLDFPFTTLSYEYETISGYERTCRASSSAFTCTKQVGMSIYYGSNYLNSELLILTDESNYNALNTWQDKNNEGGSVEVQELETSTISGRYRFNNALTSLSFPLMMRKNYKLTDCYIGIPIKFMLNNVLHYGLRWTVTKSTSSSGWGTYTLTSNRISSITQEGINDISLNNQVVDFGDTPQEIPKSILDWITSNSEPVYPYKYTVKDSTGSNTLAELTDAPSMVKTLISVIGNQKTLTLTGVNGVDYTLTWESNTPEGKQFLGLSNSPKSNRAIVPTGVETFVSWLGDLTLYESYATYRPPATTFDINLYQNSAEVNRVDKTNYLVGVGTLSGALREECSMLTPSIVYQSSDVPTFNYVYIPIFNRYYYVTSLSSVGKNLWRMELNCDVLMTYKNEIFLLQGVIGRQEIDFNPLLVDNELPTQNNPIVEVIDIPSDAFNTQTSDAGYNYVITVIGA